MSYINPLGHLIRDNAEPAVRERASPPPTSTALVLRREPVVADVAAPAAQMPSDPILAAIDAYRIAETEMKAWDAEYAAKGLAACGGFAREGVLVSAKRKAMEAVFATVPTTAAGRAALVEFAEYQIEQHDTTDGTLQEGAQTIFDLAYSGLAHAIRAEGVQGPAAAPSPLVPENGAFASRPPVPDFSGYSISDLRRTYDTLGTVNDALGLGTFFLDRNRPNNNLLHIEGDRIGFLRGYIADEIARRTPKDAIEAMAQADVCVNWAVSCGDYEEAAKVCTSARDRRL
jgi:hypothetical protein